MARQAPQPKVKKEKPIPAVVPRLIRYESLKKIEPLTPAQEDTFIEYNKGQNLVLHGMAGTGKTFVAMYLAMKEILLGETNYERLVVVRSTVPTRDLGFIPGNLEEKEHVYQLPYIAIFNEIFHGVKTLERLVHQDLYRFISTSFIRGITLHNSIIIVDESENLTGHELSSIITRCGNDCKIIFCGDKSQSDLTKSSEKKGIVDFMNVLDQLDEFSHIEFNENDIVRSSLVKNFLIAQKELGIEF